MRALAGFAFILALAAAPTWAEETGVLAPTEVLERIEAGGDAAIAIAAADLDIARARMEEAGAALMPNVSASMSGTVYRPTAHYAYPKDNADSFGGLEVVQPLFDFGRSRALQDAEDKSAQAAEMALVTARDTVLLEGLALYFDLHASELEVRALNEDFTSAYLHWDRAKENLALGRASPVEVAETLADAEKARHVYYRERSRNAGYRLRLSELMGADLPDELIAPPPPPTAKPADIDRDAFVARTLEANPEILALVRESEAAALRREGTGATPRVEGFAGAGYSTRPLRGRNDYEAGVRMAWPIFDGGLTAAKKSRMAAQESRVHSRLEARKNEMRRRALEMVMARDDAYQRVIAALARQDFTAKNLLRRQQLYDQERVADLGRAMIDHTAAEADLVRATGQFWLVQARMAVMVGEHPGRGLEEGFLAAAVGADEGGEGFVPKAGTGFGQNDQDEFKRRETLQ
ncbi:MAG: TolC family protein [Alphaproteobacteria bacterium]|nr:TolC family protein [Alphaproteobacteria bacterium]